MAAIQADINDTSKNVLWFKIAWNLYELAVANGAIGLESPGIGETAESLQKKAVYYSALSV